MEHPIYRVTGFKKTDPYTLLIKFDDGQERKIDFKTVLNGELYGQLMDEKIFDQVDIDPEIHTLVRPNGADFDPETLHNWPEYVDKIKKITLQSNTETTQAM